MHPSSVTFRVVARDERDVCRAVPFVASASRRAHASTHARVVIASTFSSVAGPAAVFESSTSTSRTAVSTNDSHDETSASPYDGRSIADVASTMGMVVAM
jgi:hypothetical protein